MTFSPDRRFAEQQDAEDALAPLRNEFLLPHGPSGTPATYLCGHSLGLQPKRVRQLIDEELDAWARLGVEGHFASKRPWLSYHELLTPALARLAGATPSEVVAMNSLTVNLHLMLATFYRPQGRRCKILIEQGAFPSDRYAVRTHLQQRGYDAAATLLEVAPRGTAHVFGTADICAAIDAHAEEIALVLLPGVQYLTGEYFDIASITACAHKHGCVVGLDLAHAMGNLPLRLHDWDVDFAVWCGYKYLNGGPGALGGVFVHERYADAFDLPRFGGWWGHDKRTRFAMPDAFVPLPGAEGWQLSNPPILAATPLIASLDLFDRAGIDALRGKSVRLTGYLEWLIRTWLDEHIEILTPSDPERRGCQLSLRLKRSREAARSVYERLTADGYVCDWREPDVIRLAPVPLYNTFVDVWEFAGALRRSCA
jgi:kynureninase